jgi:hypothetical protein
MKIEKWGERRGKKYGQVKDYLHYYLSALAIRASLWGADTSAHSPLILTAHPLGLSLSYL